MIFKYAAVLLIMGALVSGCNLNVSDGDGSGPPDSESRFEDASSSSLPLNTLSGNSMSARSGDLDGDGDLDLTVAIEFGTNKILINNGSGVFSDQSNRLTAPRNYDSQDLTIANFDQSSGPDLFFASGEQSLTNEFYLNGGSGTFSDLTNRIPVAGRSYATIAADVDRDGDPDLLIGNNGQNIVLINTGNAFFSNQTPDRLPQRNDVTQDMALGDIDGDGDLDLIVANEDDNRVHMNIGSGFFVEETGDRLPLVGPEESRDAELADIDGDGDLDLYLANVALFRAGADPTDRLLVNNGQGVFSDVTSQQLPEISTNTMDAEFVDLDRDGDPDLIAGNFDGGIIVLINDGEGTFTDHSVDWIPEGLSPRVMDIEAADYNRDQLVDLYVSSFEGQDLLLLQRD
ncbi:MAG: VCBS repeat-containing protein [Balneolaceae bacterium]|nr:VCBS repeat-containing protein [Balneolaceae bacterium]